MSYEFIKVEKQDHLFIVTINRPERMNALHPPANHELGKAYDEFAADDQLWVSIITGAGDRAFSAGNDLKVAAAGQGYEGLDTSRGFGGIEKRFNLWKPVIAAVNGVCLGGGFHIALACDIIIAAEHATFGVPESRLGRAPGTAMHFLPRMLPRNLAMDMLLTCKPINAKEAYRWGLVNEVVPKEKLMETAIKKAKVIMECAPLAIQLTKQARLVEHLPLEEATKSVLPLTEKVANSEDRYEGPKAFVQKRPPVWKAR
ncbi:MAG: enoyl-CoA hydratase/isomerase family protein [Candidatus Lambdaproteobacteria bacterium]|nr:enoyl-CoA hydratase/isomerase family protein [Candidatus Lambdaproteobacteria bacterium]